MRKFIMEVSNSDYPDEVSDWFQFSYLQGCQFPLLSAFMPYQADLIISTNLSAVESFVPRDFIFILTSISNRSACYKCFLNE